MIFSYHSVHLASKPDYDITQITVIHIKAALPYNLAGIDLQFIPLLDMIIKQGCQQVIGRCNCMEVSGKMQIQIFHRNNLGISAAGSPSLYAKAWT